MVGEGAVKWVWVLTSQLWQLISLLPESASFFPFYEEIFPHRHQAHSKGITGFLPEVIVIWCLTCVNLKWHKNHCRLSDCGTHLSLPGLSLTWKTPMTGRWSEVLMFEQLVYFSTFMSSGCRFLNRILSCEHTEVQCCWELVAFLWLHAACFCLLCMKAFSV